MSIFRKLLINNALNKKRVREPLCFTAQQDNSSIQLLFDNSNSNEDVKDIKLYYNKNNIKWQQFIPNITKIQLNKNQFVKFKNEKQTFSTFTNAFYKFKMTGKISASGNINSLIKYSNLTRFCYYQLFSRLFQFN